MLSSVSSELAEIKLGVYIFMQGTSMHKCCESTGLKHYQLCNGKGDQYTRSRSSMYFMLIYKFRNEKTFVTSFQMDLRISTKISGSKAIAVIFEESIIPRIQGA